MIREAHKTQIKSPVSGQENLVKAWGAGEGGWLLVNVISALLLIHGRI